MSPGMVRRLGRPVLNAVIRRGLVGRAVTGLGHGRTLTRHEVDEILGRLWAHFDELGHTVPWEPTFGSRMNVALAAVTIATHRALGEVGIVGPEATDVIRTIAWRIYRIWGGVPAAIARLATRDPVRRLRVSTALFRRFPFNPPGYRMKDLPATDAVAFDVDRCPVADYFRAQGQGDLCLRTWCALDEPLAELWGGTLERRGTLAGGAARCDFRWLPHEKPARRAR